MNVDAIFPSRFVKGEDIAGKKPTVTISHLTMEEMGKDKETDEWKGKKITLFTQEERHFGEMHHVIKVIKQVPVEAPKVEAEKTVMSTTRQVNEGHRDYLKKIVELSTRHDSLFEESTDLTELVGLMRQWDADGDEEMPVVPSPGRAESMYSFLLGKIDAACEMGSMGEPVLTYLLGRIITGATPPNIKCRPLLDDLRNDNKWDDALIACAFIINEQVERDE
jgi:hypothetical protein